MQDAADTSGEVRAAPDGGSVINTGLLPVWATTEIKLAEYISSRVDSIRFKHTLYRTNACINLS